MLPGPAFEIKFVIDPPTADEIIEWARVRLAPDPHGGGQAGDEYLTRSLYFDTEDFRYRRFGGYALDGLFQNAPQDVVSKRFTTYSGFRK